MHSSGPRTDAGKRRTSVNAMRHGLTISIESSAWASHLQSLEALLESDGLNQPEGKTLHYVSSTMSAMSSTSACIKLICGVRCRTSSVMPAGI